MVGFGGLSANYRRRALMLGPLAGYRLHAKGKTELFVRTCSEAG
jgi:hypothetical protein